MQTHPVAHSGLEIDSLDNTSTAEERRLDNTSTVVERICYHSLDIHHLQNKNLLEIETNVVLMYSFLHKIGALGSLEHVCPFLNFLADLSDLEMDFYSLLLYVVFI